MLLFDFVFFIDVNKYFGMFLILCFILLFFKIVNENLV